MNWGGGGGLSEERPFPSPRSRLHPQNDGKRLEQDGHGLAGLKLGHTGETASFKRSEKLRDDLMNATDAEMDTLLAAFSAEDATEIRDLTAKARNEREHSRPPHAYRALFRKLKSLPAEQ